MNQHVKRSTGFCAGGYLSKIKELDKMVVKAARLLEKCFSRPVVIRFSSERGGGAWIEDNRLSMFDSNDIGLTIRLSADDKLQVNTFVSEDKLTRKELATLGHDGSRYYSYRPHRSLRAGIRWLEKEVKMRCL